MSLNDQESPGIISFPEDGVRAVNIPAERITLDVKNGIVNPENSQSLEIGAQLSNTFQAVRSMVIVSDLDYKTRGLAENRAAFQAGVQSFEGLNELEKFELDFGLDKEPGDEVLKPNEAHIAIYMFNTEYPQMDPKSMKMRETRSRDNVGISGTSYSTELVVPGSPFDQRDMMVNNKGNDSFDAKIKAIQNGVEYELREITGVSEGLNVELAASADFYILKARENTGSTTVDMAYRGDQS